MGMPHARHPLDSRKRRCFRRRAPPARSRAAIARGLIALDREAPRARFRPRRPRRHAATRLEGNRRGEEKQGRGKSQRLLAEVAARRSPFRRWKPTRKARQKDLNDALARNSQSAARRRARRQERERQCRASSFRGQARLHVQAETAFRARRSARPDGFRNRGQTFGRAFCCAEKRPWRGSNARSASSCSMCIPASRTTIRKSRRRYWCATR